MHLMAVTLVNIPSCNNDSFLFQIVVNLPKLSECNCLKHKKEALLQHETFTRVNQMRLKVFDAIILLVQQVAL